MYVTYRKLHSCIECLKKQLVHSVSKFRPSIWVHTETKWEKVASGATLLQTTTAFHLGSPHTVNQLFIRRQRAAETCYCENWHDKVIMSNHCVSVAVRQPNLRASDERLFSPSDITKMTAAGESYICLRNRWYKNRSLFNFMVAPCVLPASLPPFSNLFLTVLSIFFPSHLVNLFLSTFPFIHYH